MKGTTLCILLMVLPLVVMSQYYRRWNYTQYNDYKTFLKSNEDSGKVKFNAVTVTGFFAHDTASPRRTVLKTISRFNTRNMNIFLGYIDSNGRALDSTVKLYDDKNRFIKGADYRADDSAFVMRKVNEYYDDYNPSGKRERWYNFNIDYYSNDYYGEKVGHLKKHKKGESNDVSYTKTYGVTTYNEADDPVKYMVVTIPGTLQKGDSKDTAVQISMYKCDDRHRITFIHDSGGFFDYNYKEYYGYNARGKEIFQANVSRKGDSSFTTRVYDNRDTLTEEYFYDKPGVYNHRFTRTVDQDGNITKTEENLEESYTGGVSCPNDKTTIMVYDNHYRILSFTETNQSSGQAEITVTTHKYLTDHDRVMTDSAFITQKGYLHAITSMVIKEYKYDSAGNETEEVEKGGGRYVTNERTIWKYNAQGKEIYMANYNNCVPDKPQKEEFYIYYPGSKSLRKLIRRDLYGKEIEEYTEDGRKLLEETIDYNGTCSGSEFKYDK